MFRRSNDDMKRGAVGQEDMWLAGGGNWLSSRLLRMMWDGGFGGDFVTIATQRTPSHKGWLRLLIANRVNGQRPRECDQCATTENDHNA